MNVLVHYRFRHRTHRAPGIVVQIEQIIIRKSFEFTTMYMESKRK